MLLPRPAQQRHYTDQPDDQAGQAGAADSVASIEPYGEEGNGQRLARDQKPRQRGGDALLACGDQGEGDDNFQERQCDEPAELRTEAAAMRVKATATGDISATAILMKR